MADSQPRVAFNPLSQLSQSTRPSSNKTRTRTPNAPPENKVSSSTPSAQSMMQRVAAPLQNSNSGVINSKENAGSKSIMNSFRTGPVK